MTIMVRTQRCVTTWFGRRKGPHTGTKKHSTENMNEVMKGALVKIHFELRHFAIAKATHDSFNSSMVQVIVLQPAKAEPISAYKCENSAESDRPIHKKLSVAKDDSEACVQDPDEGRGGSSHNSVDREENDGTDEDQGNDVVGRGSESVFFSELELLTTGKPNLLQGKGARTNRVARGRRKSEGHNDDERATKDISICQPVQLQNVMRL